MKKGSTTKKLKEVPEFQSDDEEREFWSKNDSTDFLEWNKGEIVVLPNLKRIIQLERQKYHLDNSDEVQVD